ncbi:HD phosphohydrolase domain-containing protein [Rhizophagus irregularis DAOM 181602=DAOM 197198]|nr:HD phosphohydrolase domain-containing protein [Rhizophagus irregularis DAOM 181602=DAOM 197198]
MEFKNWIIKFIDTEHLQGLRNIKQLISVAHLSRSLIKRIQETQPELEHDENEADSTLKISDSIFDANEYLKMDDTILNKIEYSNDPVNIIKRIRKRSLYKFVDGFLVPNDLKDKLTEKEINEEKIIAYQNNDGLKVDDIIQNSNDTPTNLNNSLPAHYNLEDKVEEDRSIDEDKNVDEDRNIDNYCKEC